MRVQLPSRLLTAFWPLSIPSPGAATALAPAAPSSACLPASLCSSAFIFSASFPEPSSRRCAPTLQPTARKRERGGVGGEKENGKAANPTASYSTRVYRPIMPFSDLFSSQDRSLCACIPPPHPPPCTFLLSPNKRPPAAVISAAGTLRDVTLPPPASSPDCCRGKCATRRDRQTERCLSMPPRHPTQD